MRIQTAAFSLLQVMQVIALSAHAANSGACILAFPTNPHADQVRAKIILPEEANAPMTPDIAHKAMESGAYVKVTGPAVTNDHREGQVTATDASGFTIVARSGHQTRLAYNEVAFLGAISKDDPRSRLRPLIETQAPERRQLIHAAIKAQQNGERVEVRVPVSSHGLNLTFIYRGQIRLIDAVKESNHIAMWLDKPVQQNEIDLGDGNPPWREPVVMTAEGGVRTEFPLTGPGAIQIKDFKTLNSDMNP